MSDLSGLISVLKQTRTLLALPQNDFAWSSWKDQQSALSEMDSIILQAENGFVQNLSTLFAPTGPIQEVSISSGWGQDFLVLAERFDQEFASI
jgi:hypothetical protein